MKNVCIDESAIGFKDELNLNVSVHRNRQAGPRPEKPFTVGIILHLCDKKYQCIGRDKK